MPNPAQTIKLLAMDVDGVLTRGDIIYSEDGSESKIFNIYDGLGMAVARRAGLAIAIITGRRSAAVERRANELGVSHLIEGCKNKGAAIRDLLAETGLAREEVAFIGDDLNDILAFREVGWRIAVSNACYELSELADYVTENEGGKGAVREIIEEILKSQGRWEEAVEMFLGELELSDVGSDDTAHQ